MAGELHDMERNLALFLAGQRLIGDQGKEELGEGRHSDMIAVAISARSLPKWVTFTPAHVGGPAERGVAPGVGADARRRPVTRIPLPRAPVAGTPPVCDSPVAILLVDPQPLRTLIRSRAPVFPTICATAVTVGELSSRRRSPTALYRRPILTHSITGYQLVRALECAALAA